MIDSINFIIRYVMRLNVIRLRKILKIKIKKYKYENKKTGYKNICYSFQYKNIYFKYNSNKKMLTILANAHDVLNKKEITEKDLTEYEIIVQQIVSEVLNTNIIKLELNRIDFCVDLKMEEDDMSLYIYLLRFGKKKYRYMKMTKEYPTSIYLKTKKGKTNINIYPRYHKTKKLEDKNIFRVEVQCKNKMIKSEYNKYGIDKQLINYWDKESMQEYFFDLLYNYLYEGDYYSKERSYSIIDASTNTPLMKTRLKQFLKDVEKKTLNNIIYKKDNKNTANKKSTVNSISVYIIPDDEDEEDDYKEHKYSYAVVENRIKELTKLGINPIPIQRRIVEGRGIDKMESLYKMIKRKAEEKYFK